MPLFQNVSEEAYGPGFEDIQYRVPDTSKLRQLLSFEPTKRLSDIVDEVIRDRQAGLRPMLVEAAGG